MKIILVAQVKKKRLLIKSTEIKINQDFKTEEYVNRLPILNQRDFDNKFIQISMLGIFTFENNY